MRGLRENPAGSQKMRAGSLCSAVLPACQPERLQLLPQPSSMNLSAVDALHSVET